MPFAYAYGRAVNFSEAIMATTDPSKNQSSDSTKSPAPEPTDDQPQWEDELLGGILQKPSSEGEGDRSDKGVVPGKKPD